MPRTASAFAASSASFSADSGASPNRVKISSAEPALPPWDATSTLLRLQHRQIPLDLPFAHLAVVVVPLLALQLEELRVARPQGRLDHLVAL